MKKKTAILIILICLTLCFTACAKEAKFYEYTGPMPFENSMDVSLGMSLDEVEAIVGELTYDDTYKDDMPDVDFYRSERVGSVEEGGFYTETFRFDKDGKLCFMTADISLVLDDKNIDKKDFEALDKAYEIYLSKTDEFMAYIKASFGLEFAKIPVYEQRTDRDRVYYERASDEKNETICSASYLGNYAEMANDFPGYVIEEKKIFEFTEAKTAPMYGMFQLNIFPKK